MAVAHYHHGNLRETLIDEAVAMIAEKGVEGMSLRALARKIGVSHAAPARHFKTKADLLAAVVRTAYDRMTEASLEAAAEFPDNSINRVNAMARATILWAIKNKGYFAALLNPDVSRFADQDLKDALSRYVATIADATDAAQQEGLFQQQEPRTLLIYGIAATIGTSILATDNLLAEIFGSMDDESFITSVVDQIIPMPK